ncbi:MAG TPA: DUF6049 family protein, partial [Cryobacterium sp.]|nr:DUF6049 family protein [Cryobacterium sp.]
MVAESVPARRPPLPGGRGPASRRRMRLPALLVGVLALAATVLLVPAGAWPAHAVTPAADSVSIEVTPTASSILHEKQNLQVTVSITNGTADVIAPGTIEVYLAQRALTSRSALDTWLRPAKTGNPGDLMLSAPMATAIQPGAAAMVELTVPSASVGLGAGNAWGARGIAATLTSGGNVLAGGRGTFVWAPASTVTPVKLAVVMPITTPPGTAGLIPSTALESFTGPAGLLSLQLNGVIDRPVAIAIDPMIIASIRILGSSAPPSALAWLDRLAQATNDIFPLGYADADIALQAQAGAGSVLAPISFDHAIDPALFTSPPATPADTTGPTDSVTGTPGTPTPTATPGPGAPPTTAQLLAWDYTATDIGWPGEGFVAKSDLGVFAASGLTTTILAGSNVSQSDPRSTPNTSIKLGANALGLVSDDAISAAIRAAAKATTDSAWRQAMAEVYSQLAVVSAELPGTPRTLLATFDRGWTPTETRLSQTLSTLAALPWLEPATLGQAASAGAGADVAFKPRAEPDVRLDLARQLLRREGEVTAFSSAVADPVAITGSHRLGLLALLATSWEGQPQGWNEAFGASLVASRRILHSVTVTTKGPINVVGSKVDVPVTLNNSLDQAVTVRVHVVPSNGRLVVGSDVDAILDADSARTVKVPVTAAVGNGD